MEKNIKPGKTPKKVAQEIQIFSPPPPPPQVIVYSTYILLQVLIPQQLRLNW